MSYLFRVPSDQTAGPLVSLTTETNEISLTEWTYTGLIDHPKQVRPQGGLFSMVKDADVRTVSSDGLRNEYEPGRKSRCTKQV